MPIAGAVCAGCLYYWSWQTGTDIRPDTPHKHTLYSRPTPSHFPQPRACWRLQGQRHPTSASGLDLPTQPTSPSQTPPHPTPPEHSHTLPLPTTPSPVPIGGYKDSGIGREKGEAVLHHYSHVKAVMQLTRDPKPQR